MRRLRGWHFGLQLNTRVVSAFHRRSLEITVLHLQFFPCLPTTGMFPLGETLLFWTQSTCPKEGFSLSWRDRAYASGKADLGVAFSQEWLPVQGVLSWLSHSKSWGLCVRFMCITISTARDFSVGRWDLKVLQLFCHWEEPRASEGPQWTLKAETRAGENGIPIYIV